MVSKDYCLVFYYTKPNKNSFLALIGALEKDSYFDDLDIYFIEEKKDLKIELTTLLPKYSKIVVGFSLFSLQIIEIIPIIRRLKKFFSSKNVVFIAGGPHPSGDPLGTLKLGFDIVVVGEGEETFRELLKKISSNGDYSDTKGLAFLHDSKYIFTGVRKIINLDDYPPFATKHKRFGHIEITRGCPWRCKFCSVSYIYGAKPRHRSVEEIVKWVRVAKEGGEKVINFITPNAFSYGSDSGRDPKIIRIDKIEELLSSLSRIKDVKTIFGNYLSNVRPDFVSEDLIELVKKYTPTSTIHMGGQSGSNRVLEISRIGYTVEDIRKAVKIVRNAGLKVSVDFIFGLPGETEKDRKDTLRFIRELMALRAKPRIHAFMPLPGTPFYDHPQGKVPDKYKKLFQKWALYKQVMTPFEYEEIPWNADT